MAFFLGGKVFILMKVLNLDPEVAFLSLFSLENFQSVAEVFDNFFPNSFIYYAL